MSQNVSDFDKDELAELYALGASVEELSYMSGVTMRQIYRRLKDPEVKRLVGEIRDANLSSISGLIQTRTRKAADVIEKLMSSEDERVRMSAAKIHLDYSLRLKEVEELSRRMAEMEEEFAVVRGKAVPA